MYSSQIIKTGQSAVQFDADSNAHQNVTNKNESDMTIRAYVMSILNSNKSNLINKVGQLCRQIREIAYSTIKRGVDFIYNTQQQSASVFNLLSVIEQQHYTASPAQQATTTMLKQIEITKNNLAKTMGYCLVKIGQMITGPLMRVASVIAVAGVIFTTGMVVLPVSETQARDIVYESRVQASVSQNVTEPTGNSGTEEVSYDFDRVESSIRV